MKNVTYLKGWYDRPERAEWKVVKHVSAEDMTARRSVCFF